MTLLWDLFVAPLQSYGFMRFGLAVAAIVGITSATLSCLLVVRRSALLGDAISHAVLLGVAVGWIVGGHVGIFWGALLVGMLTGLGITYIELNSRIKQDAAMGILFTFTFALGLAIISVIKPRGIDLFHILFGNVLGVSPADLWLTALSGALVLLIVVLLFKEFHIWSFDPVMARAVGLPTSLLQYLLMALLSATIVASLQAVGIVLVIAMLVIPGATAYLLADRLAHMMVIGGLLGLASAVAGLYGSFYVDVASGPAMVLVAGTLFGLALFLAPRRGVLVRGVRRRRAAQRMHQEDLLKAVFTAERETGRAAEAGFLARAAGSGPEAVSRQARRLVARGWLRPAEGGWRTSEHGQREALRLVRAHRLAERYLAEAEGLPLEELHPQAERMEHLLTPEEVEGLDRALDRPERDPHGHPIPSPGGELREIAGRALSELPTGQPARVIMVRDDRQDLLREMSRLGILPDQKVSVLGFDDGTLRARIGEQEARLAPEMAERIYVAPAPG